MPASPNRPAIAGGPGVTALVVDIADLGVCADPTAQLITYSLGSCIGLTIWDPAVRVGGLLHYMLPDSRLAPEKAQRSPGMFCDTGVPMLFRTAYELGAEKRRLVVKVAGGAQLLDENGVFNIGKRNYLALRKLLWKNGVLIAGESVGGTASRTLKLAVATGEVSVKSRSQEVLL